MNASEPPATRPILIVFTSNRDGRSRRTDGFLSQVLQRRRNHKTFALKYVAQEDRPDLLERFRIEQTLTLVVVEQKRVRGRVAKPRGVAAIATFLEPWLK